MLPFGRRLPQLDRPGGGTDAGRETGRNPGPAALRRLHRRDQHGAEASVGIKGGRLAARAMPARVMTLAIFRRAGDDPAVIGSGRPCPIRRRSPMPAMSLRVMGSPFPRRSPVRSPTRPMNHPKPDHPAFAACLQAGRPPRGRFAAAQALVQAAGYECLLLGDRSRAMQLPSPPSHATLARSLAANGRRAVILSGGELTVMIRGTVGAAPTGICAGAGHRTRGRAGHRRHCGRYRRHRRRQRQRQ